MPRLAIIVSAIGSVESWESTLVSVLENRPADCEIIVSLSQSYADPYDLKDEVRFVSPSRRGSATATINAALAQTRAPFVHLLAGGCQVEEGWSDAALERFGDRRLAAVSPLVWDARHERRLLAAGVGYRLRGERFRVAEGAETAGDEQLATVVGPSALAAFYRKAALDFVGGFSTRLGLRQADVDLALVLRSAGFATAVEPRSNVRALPEADPATGALVEALANERLFWRNLRGAGVNRAVLAHLGMVSWEILRSVPTAQLPAKLAGRFWASLEFGSHARHQRRLDELEARSLRAKVSSDHVRIDRSHEAPIRPEAARPRVPAQ